MNSRLLLQARRSNAHGESFFLAEMSGPKKKGEDGWTMDRYFAVSRYFQVPARGRGDHHLRTICHLGSFSSCL